MTQHCQVTADTLRYYRELEEADVIREREIEIEKEIRKACKFFINISKRIESENKKEANILWEITDSKGEYLDGNWVQSLDQAESEIERAIEDLVQARIAKENKEAEEV